MPARCVITGIGARMGSKIIETAKLDARFGKTGNNTVKAVTGIERIHELSDDETIIGLSKAAVEDAVERAGLKVSEIGGIFAVATPLSLDYLMPGYAVQLGAALGLNRIPMYSVSMGCAGGVHALTIARNQMMVDSSEGRKRNYIVAACEYRERLLDPSDWTTSILFSSGASAAVVTNEEKPGYFVQKAGSVALPKEGDLYSMAIENPLSSTGPNAGKFRMKGARVYRFAVGNVIDEALKLMDMDNLPDDCFLISHQPNPRMVQDLAERAGIGMDRVYHGWVDGNFSSATIFMALKDATEKGFMENYRHSMLVGFGAELQVAAAYLDKDF